MRNPKIRALGPWLVERLLLTLSLGGLLGAVLLVGWTLVWAGR